MLSAPDDRDHLYMVLKRMIDANALLGSLLENARQDVLTKYT